MLAHSSHHRSIVRFRSRRSDCPDDYDAIQGNDPETVLVGGGSCIVDPFGQVLAGPNYDGECILTAKIGLDEITRGKYHLDVVGHLAHPGVFQLRVNERAADATTFDDSSPRCGPKPRA